MVWLPPQARLDQLDEIKVALETLARHQYFAGLADHMREVSYNSVMDAENDALVVRAIRNAHAIDNLLRSLQRGAEDLSAESQPTQQETL
jgi:hypothetical protein